jgi:RES domain-containing protein
VRVYRLVKERYADSALDGSGAKAHGGRWNSKGVGVVYASDSVALAALELLVHLHRSEVLNRYVLFALELPPASVMALDEAALPPDWRGDPPPSSTAAIGDEWALSGISLALAVPSTLVPQQSNVLINPAHPDFEALRSAATAEPFNVDPRLVRYGRLKTNLDDPAV